MSQATPSSLPVVDSAAGVWKEHTRFPGIWVKPLLTSTENPLASVNRLRVPPGGVIGHHNHPDRIEMVNMLAGQNTLIRCERKVPFNSGQIAAIPAGLEHELHNFGTAPVELLTFFTPPLV